jgi:hypothetical protein
MTAHSTIALTTATETMLFSAETGGLVSFRSRAAPEQEFIAAGEDTPVFVLQYLDEQRRYRQLTSRDATADVRCEMVDGGTALSATFAQLGGMAVEATITVRATNDDRFSHWSIRVSNDAGLMLTDVQFPFVVVPYHLGGAAGAESLLWPLGAGVLLPAPQPQDLQPDCPHTWQMCPENGDALHYPGYTTAQFLAYFNDRAGIYLSCHDPHGMIKLLKPVHRAPGLRLGIAHVGDWPQHGARQLEYDIVLGSFTGDWYAAADLYRDWSRMQHWAHTPLKARADVPDWLRESPPHIILRIQGELDIGPAEPNDALLPYRKAIPLLEKAAERIGAPLVPVIMSWERPGPWIYPDCFPPAGGAEALREFTGMARGRGWHIGTFCNGTRWVVGHYWSGYDGADYFAERGGERSVCRTHAGEIWEEQWDATWRPSYPCCLGAPLTNEIAVDFVRTVLDLGLDWVQFFDQNIGASTFPCFAEDHGHPHLPGAWMTERMRSLIASFHELAGHARDHSGGARQIVLSVEGPVNEYFLQAFQICDIRVLPPGHRAGHVLWNGFVPLYHYLYHEFMLIQGGFGCGPEPYHLQIRNAYNLVVGEIPGAVMQGDGRLLNKDTLNWAPWEPYIGDNEAALTLLRAATALRRGPAREFLVYGRMQAPAPIEQIVVMRWQEHGHDHQIPAVFHSAWETLGGGFGLVLANWTDAEQTVQINDSRLGSAVTRHIAAPDLESRTVPMDTSGLALRLPPLSCALLEANT